MHSENCAMCVKTVFGKEYEKATLKIPLSDNTSRHIKDLSENRVANIILPQETNKKKKKIAIE